MVATGENRVPRRRADTGRRMSVGKTHALASQLIDVWRGNLTSLRIVNLHVAVTEIVSIDQQNIRFLGRLVGDRLIDRWQDPNHKADEKDSIIHGVTSVKRLARDGGQG